MSLLSLRHRAVILLVAACALIPSPGEAATRPAHDQTIPNVMREAAATLARPAKAPAAPAIAPAAPAPSSAVRPLREVFGFADASSLADASVGYPSWDFAELSTIGYFGLQVKPDGTLDTTTTGWSVLNSTAFTNLVTAAHGAGAKVVLTVILQDTPSDPDAGAAMCSGLTNRQATVNQVAPLVGSKNADGINIDYEGGIQTCPNGLTNQAMLVDLAHLLRGALPAGRNYLTIDTYASSAVDPGGFFSVSGLNAYVDAFFVMEYALEYSNWSYLGCASFCLSPTSPLSGYHWNDTDTNTQYANAVGAGKVIMGVPYYGDKACTAGPNPGPNAVSTGNYATSGYLYNKGIPSQTTVSSYTSHRDTRDPAGNERWDSYYFNDPTAFTCWRELYWDDTASLAQKYQLVLNQGLRGVGLWNLNLGGGTTASPELWKLLVHYFNPAGGYNILTSFGGIYSFGDAAYYGNLIDHGYPGPAIGLAETPSGRGYDILTTFGGVYSFGDAAYFGNLIDHHYPGPAVALAYTPSGRGYAILTAFGGIYSFGDAAYFGNLIDHHYPGTAVALSYTATGNGYAILTTSGAIYTFGDAAYYGNLLDHGYPGPAASLAYTESGGGYSILNQAGAIYSFGDAMYFGNLLDHGYPGPAVAISDTP